MDTEHMSRSIDVDGLVNARDLGGLRRGDGTLTPRGVFFRAENVDWIRPAGWDQLHALGVRTVVDLRQPGERARDVQARPPWLTTLTVDLDGPENTAFWKDYWDNGLCMTALYFIPHLTAMPERAGRALSALAQAPAGGVLFHCKSGRDRTGLISLLLLTAVEVEPEEIVADYMETVRLGDIRAAAAQQENAEPEAAQQENAEPEAAQQENAEPEAARICAARGTTTEGAFREAMRQLDLTWLYTAAQMDPHDVDAIRTWRGTTPR